MLKVSIITINLNNAIGLERTINSIINQSYRDFEYIVIDGASVDGSIDVINKFSEKIQYWESKADSGIYQAMNNGIKKANGEYVVFVNSGDELYNNNVLEKLIAHIGQADIIYGNLEFVSTNDRYINKYPDKLSFQFFVKYALGHVGTVIRKSLFEQVGYYDETLKIVSDWKWFMQAICKNNSTYKHINETTARFFLDGISSVNTELNDRERDSVLKNDFNLFYEDYKEWVALQKTTDPRQLQYLSTINQRKYVRKFTNAFLRIASKIANNRAE